MSSTLLLVPTIALSALPGAEAVESALERLEQAGTGPRCGTPDILTVSAAWDALSGEERSRYLRSLGGAGEGTRGSTDPPAGRAPRGSIPCGLQLPNRATSEHFSIEWGAGGSVSQAAVDAQLANLEEVRATLRDAGWLEPLGLADGFRVPMYLGNSGSGAPTISFSGGYTTICGGFEHAYIVMSDIREDQSSLDVATHELFHAVQFGAPGYGTEVEQFFFEASAVWAQEYLHPTWDGYAWMLSAYTSTVDRPLDDLSEFLRPYGAFLLPMFVHEHAPEGTDVLRELWARDRGGIEDRFSAIWEERGLETNFAEQFGTFTAFSSVMDYEDRHLYSSAPIPARDVLEEGEYTDLPAPGWYGSHYYRVEGSRPGAGETKLEVEFDGGDGAWVLALNRSPDGEQAIAKLGAVGPSGRGGLEAIDIGTLYEETWLTVTRASRAGGRYSLELRYVEQTEEPGSDLEPPGDDDDDDTTPVGSGCSSKAHPFARAAGLASYAGPGSSAGALLLLLLIARRRRP